METVCTSASVGSNHRGHDKRRDQHKLMLATHFVRYLHVVVRGVYVNAQTSGMATAIKRSQFTHTNINDENGCVNSIVLGAM